MSEEVRRGVGKTLVPVLSCNLVEELYNVTGQLVRRGKPEKVSLTSCLVPHCKENENNLQCDFHCLSGANIWYWLGGTVPSQKRVPRDEVGGLFHQRQKVDQAGDASQLRSPYTPSQLCQGGQALHLFLRDQHQIAYFQCTSQRACHLGEVVGSQNGNDEGGAKDVNQKQAAVRTWSKQWGHQPSYCSGYLPHAKSRGRGERIAEGARVHSPGGVAPAQEEEEGGWQHQQRELCLSSAWQK